MGADYSPHLKADQLKSYFQAYAKHFNLNKYIAFSSITEKVIRSPDDSKWQVYITTIAGGESKNLTRLPSPMIIRAAHMPTLEGQEEFVGIIMHSQQHQKPDEFKGRTVVIVGMAILLRI